MSGAIEKLNHETEAYSGMKPYSTRSWLVSPVNRSLFDIAVSSARASLFSNGSEPGAAIGSASTALKPMDCIRICDVSRFRAGV